MEEGALVPADFAMPGPPGDDRFRFELLGPEHNVADLEAWSSSIDHIHSTPGFNPQGWPERPYTLEENRADLVRHRDHSEQRLDFAWTVLDPQQPDVVIGCVYLYRDPTGEAEAKARSWVRADRAYLDADLRDHLRPWFETAWPLRIRYDR